MGTPPQKDMKVGRRLRRSIIKINNKIAKEFLKFLKMYLEAKRPHILLMNVRQKAERLWKLVHVAGCSGQPLPHSPIHTLLQQWNFRISLAPLPFLQSVQLPLFHRFTDGCGELLLVGPRSLWRTPTDGQACSGFAGCHAHTDATMPFQD